MIEPTEEERTLWRTFFVMRRQLDLNLERRLQSDSGISGADFEILASLAEEPTHRRRSGQIGDIIGWEKSRVSHQITRMEQRGLVVRETCDDDARGVWVSLTPEGRRAALRAARDHGAAIREYFFDLLDERERAMLLTVSKKVLDTIDPPLCEEEAAEGAEENVA